MSGPDVRAFTVGPVQENAYIVRANPQETRALLVDPGEEPERLLQAARELGVQIEAILITHCHFDHIGDAVEIAKNHNPVVVAIPELAHWLGKKGVKQVSEMNKGGTQTIGDIKVTMVHTDHSCGIADSDQIVYGGEACGFVIEFSNGVKIYHAGDTNVFSDMAIIRDLYAPQIAMIPIGDHYTMSPREAAYACSLLKPKTVVPMHFGTFPVLTGKPVDLQKLVPSVEVLEMTPGVTLT